MKPKYFKIEPAEYPVIVELYKNKSTSEIANMYDVERVTISRILTKNGVLTGKYQTNNNKWKDKISREMQERIATRYADRSTIKTLSSEFSLPSYAIRSVLKNKNIKLRDHNYEQRKYYVNFDYFSKINSSDKAYFLGLMYSDGCNTRRGIAIYLNKEDSYILEEFAKRIHTGAYRLNTRKSKNVNYSDSVGFTVSSVRLSDQLSALGVVPKKSLILKFPKNTQVPSEHIWHFVRGYFDGDGSVYVKRKNTRVVDFVGAHEFIRGLYNFLVHSGVSCSIYKYKLDTTSHIKIMAAPEIKKFYNMCYENSGDLYLKRKFKKFVA